ncbi:MAG: PrgI family protein [Candidatus Nealsonbacteria bacterium]|nr:PrgI family protein [Candidatus Nealsonbacteria bacterium]
MRFTIPQFIEHEAKIIGPLTFKQVIFIGTAGVICFILYFLVPFSVFLVACVILVGGGIALAFLKIGGRSLPLTLVNFLKFSVMPKIYIWKKREQSGINVYKKKTEFRAALSVEKGEESPLKIGGKSQLKKLHNEIEIKTK